MAKRISAHLWLAFFFSAVVFLTHSFVLETPYFWDEMGQFVPSALDVYHSSAWIPYSTLPNVHPPGVPAYLAVFWMVFGYSVVLTRVAMLLLAGAGVFLTFLLAVQLCKPLPGFPAFVAVLLLCSAPLFWAQTMLAQLDMPAMVFSLLALLLFFREQIPAAALACVAAVLMKETSLAVPLVLGAYLLWERRLKQALWFTLPAFVLSAWLAYLYSHTGHLFGNAEFTHYNLTFQLHPVRLVATLLRRVYYLFGDNFHWIGSIAILLAWRKTNIFRSRTWVIVLAVFTVQTLVVTVLGGAALERYLMPVLPLFYIAVAAAFTTVSSGYQKLGISILTIGLLAGLFINSPLTYPYENNYAFIDFVTLQKSAAEFLEADYAQSTVISAWPLPDALRRPEFGYVSHAIKTVGIENFDVSTVLGSKGKGDVLVLYSRTWEPPFSVVHLEWVQRFLATYYFYQPQITAKQVQDDLGMTRVGRWERRGQWIEVYAVQRTPNVMTL